MATIVINGVETPRGTGEQEYPRFEVTGSTLLVKLNANAEGLPGNYKLTGPIWDTAGALCGLRFMSAPSPGPSA